MLFYFSIISNNYLNEVKATRRIQTYEYKKDLEKAILKYMNFTLNFNFSKLSVIQYIEYQKTKENANSTINKRVGYIKEVIKFFIANYDMESIDKKQLLELKKILAMPKLSQTPIHKDMLSKNDMKKYIDYVLNLDTTTYINSRDKIALYLFLSTGIRLNELIHLKTKEIDLKSGFITLHFTKTNDERKLPLDDYVINLLRNHLSKYGHFDYLITSTKSLSCFTIDGLNKYLHKLFNNKIGLDISSRSLRHTFATTTLRNGMPINDVALIMGHKDINTTQIYLHSDDDIIKENHKKFSPFSVAI